MKYNNDSRIKHSKQNRDKIILAAKKLVFEKGYDKISVSEITKKAGVSKGSFYIHYHTKDDLIQDIINFTFDDARNNSNEGNIQQRISHFLVDSVNKIVDGG